MILASTAVFALVFGVVALANVLNRDSIKMEQNARKMIIEKLSHNVGSCEIDDFLRGCLPEVDFWKAKMLLSKISDSTNIPAGYLLFRGRLIDNLSVNIIEGKDGKVVRMDPFPEDILWAFGKCIDKEKLRKKMLALPEIPETENAFMDFFMDMTMEDFLKFFAPLVRD